MPTPTTRLRILRGLAALGCVLSSSLVPVGAADEASPFEQSNRLYEEGKFAEAAAGYRRMLDGGRVSPALYFNFGNALFKSGHVGEAIFNYRLAQEQAPRDPDIRANLRFARNQVDGGAAAPPPWRRWLGQLSLDEWTALAAASGWLWFILLAARQWRPVWKRGLRGWTWACGVAAALFSCALALTCRDRFEVRSAIVVTPEAVVRYGPIEESNRYYTARDGTELVVLDSKGDWLQVTDRGRRTGWLRRQQVKVFPATSRSGDG